MTLCHHGWDDQQGQPCPLCSGPPVATRSSGPSVRSGRAYYATPDRPLPPKRHLGRKFLTLVLVLGIAGGATYYVIHRESKSTVSSAAPLSDQVLPTTLSGFVAYPPGPRNGPMSLSKVAGVMGLTTPEDLRQIHTLVSAGYVRMWRREPWDGSVVMVYAFRAPNAQAMSAMSHYMLIGIRGFARQMGGSTFKVTSVAGATGATTGSHVSGAALVERYIVFARGTTMFMVFGGAPVRRLSAAAVTDVAAEQSSRIRVD